MHLKGFLVLGAVTGALSAAAAFIPLGNASVPKVLGYCFGIDGPGGRCNGIEASFYLFPGLIFGIAFAGIEGWCGRLNARRTITLIVAAGIGNAVATFLCVGLFTPLTRLLNTDFLDIPIGLAGAVSGAVGGGLLSGTAKLICGARVRLSIAIAAALGLLVPLVPEWPVAGVFAFYILWQAGYAGALGAGLPGET